MSDAQILNFFGRDQQIESDFEAFWRTYPRRIGRGAARKAFEKAVKRVELPELMTAVARFAEHPESIAGKRDSIPHASTWLNQERWNDEPEPVQAAMERHPSFARIPSPVESCDKCDHGFIELENGSVRRCDHAS